MRDAVDIRQHWHDRSVAMATVVSVRGSAPRPAGARFFVAADGAMAGSVSGGCVENDVAMRAQRTLTTGTPELVEYGIADDEAFDLGLTCGGTIGVFIERFPDALVGAADELIRTERLGAVVTVVSGESLGSGVVVDAAAAPLAGDLDITAIAPDLRAMMTDERVGVLTLGSRQVFVETIAPAPVMLIFGAGHAAQPLARMAGDVGFRVVVSDARQAWATVERFPDVDDLVVDWPPATFERHPLDHRTYVVLLSHDARFEEPVLDAVRDTPVRYIGAMGSRRTHAARLDRLSAAGWSPEQLSRIHGPIGLDIGATTPEEMAVSIIGEVISARHGHGTRTSLTKGPGPIHAG